MSGLSNFLCRASIGMGAAVWILACAAAPAQSAAQTAAQVAPAGASMQQASKDTVLPTLDLKQSSIRVTFKKLKVPITRVFKKFSGELVFDPERPAAGHVRIEVEVGSISLRDAKLSREVQSVDWLDTEQFPTARFVSSAIVTAGDGKYSVAGKLTLHGKTLNVVVPMSYTQAGHTQVFDGVLPIRRQQFGVGLKSLQVADNVVIAVHLVSLPLP